MFHSLYIFDSNAAGESEVTPWNTLTWLVQAPSFYRSPSCSFRFTFLSLYVLSLLCHVLGCLCLFSLSGLYPLISARILVPLVTLCIYQTLYFHFLFRILFAVLTWLFHFLATHQNIQEKVFKEIKDVLGKNKVDHNTINNLV